MTQPDPNQPSPFDPKPQEPTFQQPAFAPTPTPKGAYEPGAPNDPNYGVAPGGPAYPPLPSGATPATAGQRLIGSIIDGIVLSIVLGVVGSVTRDGATSWGLWALVTIAYCAYFNGQGQTIGKMVMKTKVVDVATGEPIGLQRGLIRALLQVVFNHLAGLPYLSILFDPRGRGWHDQVANDVVVKLP